MAGRTRSGKSSAPQTSQPDTKLRCVFIHPNPGMPDPFTVTLTQTEYGMDLIKVRNRFADAIREDVGRIVVPRKLQFRKVAKSIPVCTTSLDDFGNQLMQVFSLEKHLGPYDNLPDDVIHLAIGLPEGETAPEVEDGAEREEKDIPMPLPQNDRFIRKMEGAQKAKSPSSSSKSVGYSETQAHSDTVVCDGLVSGKEFKSAPSTVAPPIHIFHPVFQQFTRDANDCNTPLEPHFLKKVLEFMQLAAQLKTTNGNSSNQSIRDRLTAILGRAITADTNADSTSADIYGGMSLQLNDLIIQFPSTIGEIKRAHGEGGNEVTIQATNSWRKAITQTVSKREEIVKLSCSPAFIIAIAGSWIVILGAVFTEWFIVKRLTSMLWLAPSDTHDERHVREVGRVLRALKNGIAALDDFYKELVISPVLFDPTQPHPRNFPYPNSYSIDNQIWTFRYLKPLEDDPRCVTYQAEITSSDEFGQKIVVKFVETYSEDVHTFLAGKEHAPKLRYFGKLPERVVDASATTSCPVTPDYGAEGVIAPATQMKMVVMDFVEGTTPEELTPEAFDQLKNILADLHQAEFVFGDLRLNNMVIDNKGNVHLIDFDWAGCFSSTTPPLYPLALSTSLYTGIEGVDPLKPIRPEHDLEMLKRLPVGTR